MRHIPNMITAIRFVLAMPFAYFMAVWFISPDGGLFAILMILFFTICLSDLMDGKTARILKAVSLKGTILDVTADLFYIVLSLAALNLAGIIPVWFTAFVLLKFFEFLVTSRRLAKLKGHGMFVTDIPGKVAAGLYFALPGIVLILYRINSTDYAVSVSLVTFSITALSVLSSFIRCWSCLKVKLEAVPAKQVS